MGEKKKMLDKYGKYKCIVLEWAIVFPSFSIYVQTSKGSCDFPVIINKFCFILYSWSRYQLS